MKFARVLYLDEIIATVGAVLQIETLDEGELDQVAGLQSNLPFALLVGAVLRREIRTFQRPVAAVHYPTATCLTIVFFELITVCTACRSSSISQYSR